MFWSQLFDHFQGVVEGRPPEDGQTIVTEICRVLIMCFYKHF